MAQPAKVLGSMTMGTPQPAKVFGSTTGGSVTGASTTYATLTGGVNGTTTFAAGAPVVAAAPVMSSVAYPAPVTFANTLAPTAASYTYGAAPSFAFANPPQQVIYPTAAVASQVVAYTPTSVQAAWDNHFDAFGKQNLEQILLDYDESSVMRIYNTSDAKKVEFFGVAGARAMFEKLFKDLADLATLDAPNVDVDEAGKQVFLIWNCPGCGFESCTDTFIFGPDFKIKRQNIVVTNGKPKEGKEGTAKKEKKAGTKKKGCC